MKDQVIKSLIFNENVRLYVASSTNLVNEMQKRQNLWPTTLAALGRTLTVTAMMGLMLKQNSNIAIEIDGKGPAGRIITGGNSKGEVKGYIEHPEVHFEYHDQKKLNVGMAVGNEGFLTVTKDLGFGKIYTSQVELIDGEIADDFTYYFAKSEQIPTSVGLGVLVDVDNKAISSGGFILQVLPNCPDEIIDKLEEIINNLGNVSDIIKSIDNLEDFIKLFSNDYKILDTLDIKYQCDCSREKFLKGLKSINKDELNKILEEDKKIETVCNFCLEKYTFTKEDFEK